MLVKIICNQKHTVANQQESEREFFFEKEKPIQKPYAVCHAGYEPHTHAAAAANNTVRATFLCTCTCSNVANHVVIERPDRNYRSNALKTDCSSKITQPKNIEKDLCILRLT